MLLSLLQSLNPFRTGEAAQRLERRKELLDQAVESSQSLLSGARLEHRPYHFSYEGDPNVSILLKQRLG